MNGPLEVPCPTCGAGVGVECVKSHARRSNAAGLALAQRARQAPSDSGCGTTGCEAHDGECQNDWAGMR